MSKREKFLDGCHKYGWIITIVVQLFALSYFGGQLTARVDDVIKRVDRIESRLDQR